jgi:hypothetical protein
MNGNAPFKNIITAKAVTHTIFNSIAAIFFSG